MSVLQRLVSLHQREKAVKIEVDKEEFKSYDADKAKTYILDKGKHYLSMGNGHAIMTSFNRAGCIWTSASSNLMININRDEFEFDGYSLTDMAASNAGAYMLYNDGIYNGTDLFLGTGSESALKEYKNNATFVNRVRDSAHRVLYVICNFSAAMNGISPSGRIVNITPWWKSLLIALIIAFAVIAVVLYTLYFIFEYKKKKED